MSSDRLNASTLVDRNLEAGRGDKAAYLSGDEVVSYDDLSRGVAQAGNLLRSLGARREDRVLMVLDDTPAFPFVFLGAMRAGAVPVPVSPLDRADNYRHFVEDSYARIVVGEAALMPMLREALAGVPELVFVSANGAAEGALDLGAALAEQSAELAPAPTHRDDMAFWLYSSGSTGRPKGVVHLHHDIGVTCETYASQVLGVREDDLCFSTTKLYHAYGLGNGLTFPLYFGATAALNSGPPKPPRIVEALRRYRPTLFFSVPALFAALVRDGEGLEEGLARTRFCVSAAEALPPATFDRWLERFGLEIVDGIGSTEMLHIFCSNRPGAIDRGTTGRPVPGYELRIVDEAGHELEGEAVGSLEVRGDSCAAFYWHQHEKTKSCMRGDWLSTGDRFRRQADGAYAYEGRNDDMLKVGGLWVSPVDMENALMRHPAVAGVGVVGARIEDQSRIAAFVELAEGFQGGDALADELRTWCHDNLRRYEVPHVVEFVEGLPRTVTGKVQRFRLRGIVDREGAAAG